jgi:hypothetical protein
MGAVVTSGRNQRRKRKRTKPKQKPKLQTLKAVEDAVRKRLLDKHDI